MPILRTSPAEAGFPRTLTYGVEPIGQGRSAVDPQSVLGSLTPFELRTMEMLAAGLDRNEIAQILHRAPKTISNCLTTAKEKLGARSLAEAAALLAAAHAIRRAAYFSSPLSSRGPWVPSDSDPTLFIDNWISREPFPSLRPLTRQHSDRGVAGCIDPVQRVMGDCK
jgi:DNA-binding CsgD family transcriptional regulator